LKNTLTVTYMKIQVGTAPSADAHVCLYTII